MEELENDVSTDMQVLAACFRVEDAVGRFVEELDRKDVGYVNNNLGIHDIYCSVADYYNATGVKIVDPIVFESWLSKTNIYDTIGGKESYDTFISALNEVKIGDIDSLIKFTRYQSNQQRTLDSLQKATQDIGKSPGKNGEIVAKLIEDVSSYTASIGLDPFQKVRTADDILNGADNLWDMDAFLETPFKNLNRALGYGDTGGFFRGGVHSIVALSGYGKSTLTKNLCNHWIDNGLNVLFINFEEPQAHWERILMTQMTGVNVYAEHEKMTSIQMADVTKKFRDRIGDWGGRLMVRHDPDTLYFEDLEQWLRQVNASNVHPDIVVIDTIQSMFTKTGGRARWGDYEQIMVRSEKLAKEMDAAFIFTAQQNLSSTKERRDMLDQSDMGGSATITQKSTVAMFLTPLRGSDDENDTASDRIMQLQIVKSRITGTSSNESPPLIEYDDSTKSYTEYDPRKQDANYSIPTVDVNLDI